MAGEISDAVKKVVALLKNATNDTEKFTGLFLVTKLVKAKDCKTAAKTAIFEAIGFDFLKRLLLTSDVPVDCPPSIYKSVALSVLTCFCYEPDLATRPEMLANIPVFLDIVQQADIDDDNLIIVGEAYGCLKAIAQYDPGQQALLEVGAVTKMSEIYAQQSFQTDEALNILVTLVSRFGSSVWDSNNLEKFQIIINKIALDFETDQDERKFELCQILNALLFNAPKEAITKDILREESWPQSIYKGLTDILQSKITKDQRNPALLLTSTMVTLLGIDWILTDEIKGKQIFLLLIQLAAIEVRMQLEGKSLKQTYSQAALITGCFIVIELSVNYIAEQDVDLDQKEKQTLYTGLKGAFSAIVGLLTKISNDKNKDNLPVNEKVFVCAALRVLVSWLAQETSAMRPQIYQLLPFILGLANETHIASRTRRLAEKAGTAMDCEPNLLSQIDILRITLPALCHLTVEDEARKVMLKIKQDEVLFECFEFHWNIVQRKKPPVPRSERLKLLNQPPEVLSPEVIEEMEDSRAAMISICNIFMNITVLEAKIVEDSALFNKLLQFIFENLSELKSIKENIVLHGHMAILGLLLLKQQCKKVKKDDFSICRYIQVTIRFLWDAYVIDESIDSTALIVAMDYKEHWMEIMELWFLGMQTMSSVLAVIPWISEFAIESGWALDIIKKLRCVKAESLPANMKSAYEDFLCHLVDASPDVAAVFKKADALKVCRNHRLMDLGKKLFGD